MNHTNPHRVAVIGAGPVGLAAAAHLLARGLEPRRLRGRRRRRREHPRVGPRARVLALGVQRRPGRGRAARAPRLDGARRRTATRPAPRSSSATSSRWPRLPEIAAALHLGARVIGVTRAGIDKLKDAGRDERAVRARRRASDGVERRYLARAVIDASGTWTRPNPLGAGGLPAAGERAHADRIAYGIPDVLGADRARYAGKRVLVVGSGHSAFNAILDLVALRDSEPATQIVWAIRGGAPGPQVRRRRRRPAAGARRARRGRPRPGRGRRGRARRAASRRARVDAARRRGRAAPTASARSSPTR